MRIFAEELALELSTTLNKELRAGLRAEGSNAHPKSLLNGGKIPG